MVIVNGEHVDGDDLQHVRAAQQGRAVLQQRPELLQDAACHSWEGLHAVEEFPRNTCRNTKVDGKNELAAFQSIQS